MATDLLSVGMVGLDHALLGGLQRGKAKVAERTLAQPDVLSSRLEESVVGVQPVLEGLKQQSVIPYKTGIGHQLLHRHCEPDVTGNWVMTCYLRH